MQRLRRPALILGLLSLIANTACYAYQPVLGTPHVGTGVRFQLSAEGTAALAAFLGPNVLEVTGRLNDVLPSGVLVVAPEWVKTSNGVLQPWSGEGAVQFSREYVRALDVRTFNRRRTTMASITVVSGLLVIAVIALKAGGSHGSDGPSGGSPTR